MKFTEAQLEAAISDLLGEVGYPHVLGEGIDPPDGVAGREPQEVLIESDLRAFLAKRYAGEGITPGEIDAVLQQLRGYSTGDLYESNRSIMKLVADGLLLKREDRSKKDLYVQLIDYSALPTHRTPEEGEVEQIGEDEQAGYNKGKNTFKFVTQLEISGYEKRIPDGILYINGLPLVVFEFKSAIREDATICDAFIQLTVRYRRDIPELLKFNAFCVISDGVNSKCGSFFAPYEFWYAWRRAERIKHPHPRPLSQGERGGHDSSPPGKSRDEGPQVNFRGGFDFSGLKRRARELRQEQTPAEDLMWELLRNRQVANLKFRRQHQIGPYIVDFFCNEVKLVIELDGEVHSEETQAKKDKKRDAYLRSLGFEILRFKNQQFQKNPEAALKKSPVISPLPMRKGPTAILYTPRSPRKGPIAESYTPLPLGEGAGVRVVAIKRPKVSTPSTQ